MADTRTATEVLIEAMTEFGKSEPVHVLVIYTDAAGDMVRMSNATFTQQAGLCECAKESIFRRMFPVKIDG